jgi:hypothetical protein
VDDANYNVGFEFENFSCGEYVKADDSYDAIGKAFAEIWLKGFIDRGGSLNTIHLWRKDEKGIWKGITNGRD